MKSTQDYLRYKEKSFPKAFLLNPAVRFLWTLRICQKYSKFNLLGILGRLYFKRLKVVFGYQIPFSTKIGKGLYLGHFGNIIINSKTTIGENCNIAQGVTIGFISRGAKKGAPKIGDNVWIGANSVVVGSIKIGDGALIAPLTFINFDIPENAVVSGNPAKILSYKGSLGYVNNKV